MYVLVVGLLAGFMLAFSLIGDVFADSFVDIAVFGTTDGWVRAHGGGIMNAIMMVAFAFALPQMRPGQVAPHFTPKVIILPVGPRCFTGSAMPRTAALCLSPITRWVRAIFRTVGWRVWSWQPSSRFISPHNWVVALPKTPKQNSRLDSCIAALNQGYDEAAYPRLLPIGVDDATAFDAIEAQGRAGGDCADAPSHETLELSYVRKNALAGGLVKHSAKHDAKREAANHLGK